MANRSDDVPIRPGTRFGLASVTKMFTAVTVATLVDRGVMAFEDRVVDLVPETRRPATLDPTVTVHHLLTHTSGIADYFDEEEEMDWSDYSDLWLDRPSYAMREPADFLPLFGALPPKRPPGPPFAYSNAGFILLGLVVEDVAGVPFVDAATDSVFTPAGMVDSGFPGLDEVHPAMAAGYLPPRRQGEPWRTNVYSVPVIGGPDGGAFSTTRDLSRFLTAFAAGALVGPEIRDRMLVPHVVVGDGDTYGYGFWLRGAGNGRCFGHGGGDPGVEALVYRFPELATNVVVLGNTNGGFVGEVRDLVVAELLATYA